jgi:hypothetical protein
LNITTNKEEQRFFFALFYIKKNRHATFLHSTAVAVAIRAQAKMIGIYLLI